MAKSKVRLGIAGLGHIASHQLAALRRRSESYEIVGVCDSNFAQFSRVSGVDCFVNISDMLGRVDMDVLLVSVPNRDHFEVARAALSARVSVLVEKPATETVEEFQQLMRLAETNNILIHTAFHAAFARDLLWFREERTRLKAELGPITGIRCEFYDPYVLQTGEISATAQRLGGSWIDSGINALSVIDSLLPDFEIEEARMTKVRGTGCQQVQGAVDFTFGVDEYETGGQGLIDTNWTLGLDRKTTELFFSQSGHRVKLDHSGERVLISGFGKNFETRVDFSGDVPRLTAHYLGVFDDFLLSFAKGEDNSQKSLRLLKKLHFKD